MTNVTNTIELYQLLTYFNIDILSPNGEPRDMEDIIYDMFVVYSRYQPARQEILQALKWMANNGCKFNDLQTAILEHCLQYQDAPEFISYKRTIPIAEANTQKDETIDEELTNFINSFKIIGGDAL